MGGAFKFGLQKVLEIRENQEEESKRRFKECQREKELTRQKLQELNDSYKKYQGIKPGEELVYQRLKRNYLIALENGINQTKSELKQKEEALEYSRIDLKNKQINRKTVQTLKEKQYTSYVKEQERIEQINNDEFALYSYMRNAERG